MHSRIHYMHTLSHCYALEIKHIQHLCVPPYNVYGDLLIFKVSSLNKLEEDGVETRSIVVM